MSLTAVLPRLPLAVATLTRPANATPYTDGDAILDVGGAALAFQVTDANDRQFLARKLRIRTNDTGVANKSFRAYFFDALPTPGAADNAPWSQPVAGFVGSMVGTFLQFSDGGVALCTPEYGADIQAKPAAGTQNIYVLLQVVNGFTPSANSTVYTCTLEAQQGC